MKVEPKDTKGEELLAEDARYPYIGKKGLKILGILSGLFLAMMMYASYKRSGNFFAEVFTGEPILDGLIFFAILILMLSFG